jgi:hypothetical protein
MRRSSCVALCIAPIFFLVAAYFYVRSFSTNAPRMTNEEASRLIASGKQALERKDVGRIIGMMAPNAKIVNRSLSEIEGMIETAMRQVKGNLSVVSRNVQTHQTGSQADITFDMDVIQKSSKLDAVYYPNLHVTVQLETRRIDRWLGLFSTEEWKIVQVDTIPVIETTPP